jgi:hypothetical protein
MTYFASTWSRGQALDGLRCRGGRGPCHGRRTASTNAEWPTPLSKHRLFSLMLLPRPSRERCGSWSLTNAVESTRTKHDEVWLSAPGVNVT